MAGSSSQGGGPARGCGNNPSYNTVAWHTSIAAAQSQADFIASKQSDSGKAFAGGITPSSSSFSSSSSSSSSSSFSSCLVGPSLDGDNGSVENGDVTALIQDTLAEMQSKFERISSSIVGRLDDLGQRIDDLETSLGSLIGSAAGLSPDEAAPDSSEEDDPSVLQSASARLTERRKKKNCCVLHPTNGVSVTQARGGGMEVGAVSPGLAAHSSRPSPAKPPTTASD